MATWATRRKLFYILLLLAGLIIIVGVPIFVVLYESPTCQDGILNQKEEGIDCGGPCAKICSNYFLAPNVSWSRINYVAPGVYNAASYIINPNNDGIAFNVPYVMTFYDSKGIYVAERKGAIDIPPHKNVLAFESGIETGERVPTRVVFEFTAAPEWQKYTLVEDEIDVSDVDLLQDETGMSLTAKLINPTFMVYKDITVYAVLADSNGNTVAFSRTKIDELKGNSQSLATFTWPFTASTTIASKEVIAVVETIIDPRKGR